MCDVQDGTIVRELMRSGKFLSVPEHAALMMNTDGVQTFNSSKHSIWPVYLCIPPHLRMNEKFQLLAGAWYGPKKPKKAIGYGFYFITYHKKSELNFETWN